MICHLEKGDYPQKSREMKIKRGSGIDAKRVKARLSGFEPSTSEAWNKIVTLFSSGITHCELRSLAQLICLKTDLRLDRDASRDLRVLVKWFSDNWGTIDGIIHLFQLRDDKNEVITLSRELQDYGGTPNLFVK